MTGSVRMPRVPDQNQIEAAVPLLSELVNPTRAKRLLHAIYETFVDMRPDRPVSLDMTKRMAQLYEVIDDYIYEHGRSPTQDELAEMLGLHRTTIYQRLHAMKKRGLIIMTPGRRRNIKLVKE